MRRKVRLALLFTTLAGVAAWAALGGNAPSSGVVAASSRAAPTTPAPAPAQPPAADPAPLPDRPAFAAMGADPFNVEAPQPAATAVAAPPPPAKPVPPPLPYRFAGRLHIGDSVEVYLTKGEELVPVKKGDKLDGQYRVEKIGRTEMTLLHLASGVREKIEYDPPIKEDVSAVAEEAPKPERHAEAQRKGQRGS